jgi:hypothetical protein
MTTVILKPEVLALVGLSSLSVTMKSRNDRRSDFATAVSRLLPELMRVETLKSATEGFKDTSESWEEYERTRIALWSRHGQFFQNTTTTDWDTIADRIAKHKPILSIKVRSLIDLGRSLQKNELKSVVSSSSDAYVKLLSALEVSHNGLIKELHKAVRYLSWSGGIGIGVSFEIFMIKRGGGAKLRDKNHKFIKNFHMDVWSDLSAVEDPKTPRK